MTPAEERALVTRIFERYHGRMDTLDLSVSETRGQLALDLGMLCGLAMRLLDTAPSPNPETWFPDRLHALLTEAKTRNLSLAVVTDALLSVTALLCRDLPPEHQGELVRHFIQRLGAEAIVIVEAGSDEVH